MFLLINNLPEVDDHSTLYQKYARYSDFKVKFAGADLLDFKVSFIDKDGKVAELDPAEYTLQFSKQTTLDNSGDNKKLWDASELTESDGWYTLAQLETAGLSLEDMRSFRVVVKDAVPANATIRVEYNGQIQAYDENGNPPTESVTAWNSFGYALTMGNSTLATASLDVGVRTAGVPYITKDLVDAQGNAVAAAVAHTYKFLIYKGEYMHLDAAEGEAALLDQVAVDGRAATVASVEVEAGQSASTLALSDLHPFAKDESSGTWSASSDKWLWEDDETYTIMELCADGTALANAGSVVSGKLDDFAFYSINGRQVNGAQFDYDNTDNQEFLCKNQRASWSILLEKTGDDGHALADAWFGLYSKDASDAADSADFEVLASEVGNLERSVMVDGTTWYLVDAQRTSSAGVIKWDDLCAAEYYVCELRAPNGYAISASDYACVVEAQLDGNRQVTESFVNYLTYQLPSTGGPGAAPFVAAGLTVLACACAMLLRARRGTIRP
jgi:hypothetical protein